MFGFVILSQKFLFQSETIMNKNMEIHSLNFCKEIYLDTSKYKETINTQNK